MISGSQRPITDWGLIQLNKGVAHAHLEDSTMIRDAVKFIGAVQFITITIGRCCLEYFDQLLVLAPVMEERN